MTARVNRETADDYIFCEGHVRGSEQNSDHIGSKRGAFHKADFTCRYTKGVRTIVRTPFV